MISSDICGSFAPSSRVNIHFITLFNTKLHYLVVTCIRIITELVAALKNAVSFFTAHNNGPIRLLICYNAQEYPFLTPDNIYPPRELHYTVSCNTNHKKNPLPNLSIKKLSKRPVVLPAAPTYQHTNGTML